MRTIDLSKYQSPSGVSGIMKSLQGAMSYGYSWQQSRKNQEELIEILGSVLGNECVLLRDVNIPKVSRPIPMVLVTPSTVMVVNPKSQHGFFRAEGTTWSELGTASLHWTARLRPSVSVPSGPPSLPGGKRDGKLPERRISGGTRAPLISATIVINRKTVAPRRNLWLRTSSLR